MESHHASVRLCLVFLTLGFALLSRATPAAAGLPILIVEYPLPEETRPPHNITAGLDGNIWFTHANAVGRITPNGAVTIFPPFGIYDLVWGITAGPDGNIWFTVFSHTTGSNWIGRITPAGVVTHVADKPAGSITTGPDGNLWFTGGRAISWMTTTGVITEFTLPMTNTSAVDITTGPDGNLWFTEYPASQIGRITPAGVITEFSLPPYSGAEGITAGPDGNVWLAENTSHKIGRITPSGMITEFPTLGENSAPFEITTGPDGNLWFTAGNVGRITPAGVITEFPIPTGFGHLEGITTGPDGNLWFAETSANKIGKMLVLQTRHQLVPAVQR
jgi:streptogramin lyase